MARLSFQMHVGEENPKQRSEGAPFRRRTEPTALASPDFPWDSFGVEPRFLGAESTDCVAGLQPNIFSGHGASELERFLRGASSRDETALLISMIGEEHSETTVPWASHDASVNLRGLRGHIAGKRLPEGTEARIATGITGADKDLALRLTNRQRGMPWWALAAEATVGIRGDGSGSTLYPVDGEFRPLVMNNVGETLAGVWIPEVEDWRWYVVPWGTDWKQLLRWTVDRALPEFVPGALRRAQAPELVDSQLLTAEELAASDAVATFEEKAAEQRSDLSAQLTAAQDAASDIRSGLLYATGGALVSVVSKVLEQAGFDVEDLDETFGEGVSADLLASAGSANWLIEVKSASGSASEDLVEDLQRHVRTWPELSRPEMISGGVLIVNHQYKRSPVERQSHVYPRAEFVASLPVVVVPTLALFAWWRDRDSEAIRHAVQGPPHQYVADLERPAVVRTMIPQTKDGPASTDEPGPVRRSRRTWIGRLLKGDS
jgi:hypothetical protein